MGCSTCSASKLDSSFGTVLLGLFQFFLLESLTWTLSKHLLLGVPSAGSEVAVLAVDVRFEHLGLFPGIDLCLLCELD